MDKGAQPAGFGQLLSVARSGDRAWLALVVPKFTAALRSIIAGIRTNSHALSQALHAAAEGNGPLAPLVQLFHGGQLHAILLALIPARFGSLLTGVMSVDLFLTTFIATAVVSGVSLAGKLASHLLKGHSSRDKLLSVKVEFLTIDQYSEKLPNPHWNALAWLASRSATAQAEGSYRMVVSQDPAASEWERLARILDLPEGGGGADTSLDALTAFNILPSDSSKIRFPADGYLFDVWFDNPASEDGDGGGGHKSKKSSSNGYEPPSEPALIVQRVSTFDDTPAPATVEWMTAWLMHISRQHQAHLVASRKRARYEIRSDSGYWVRTRDLHCTRGLGSVALDKMHGELLRRDLESFVASRGFYSRIGMPYRRGYLFSGRPGTGKTSLVQAISAAFSRDLYYLDLKNIKDNASLQSAFSTVPRNGIIVLEDVDAQSTIVHRRLPGSPSPKLQLVIGHKQPSLDGETGSLDEELSDDDMVPVSTRTRGKGRDRRSQGPSKKGMSSGSLFGPTLSALLNCLDGYAMNEGVIVVMTSNHPELLDPALIRPGRVDMHLELGYCSHFQLRQMFSTVIGCSSEDIKRPASPDSDASGSDTTETALAPELDLVDVPEKVIPPCDAMRIMVLHRDRPWEISGKLRSRAKELLEGKGVGEAMSFEEDETTAVEEGEQGAEGSGTEDAESEEDV